MDRIDFLRKLAAGGSFLLAGPAFLASCSKDDDTTDPDPGNGNDITIDLSDSSFDDLDSVGGYVYYGSMIIFRTGNDSYRALSKKCTHQGCDVTYDHSSGDVPCPCHGSVFTTSGVVTNGPAMTNLTSYSVVKSGNTLTIK